jgi:hypothetical protein
MGDLSDAGHERFAGESMGNSNMLKRPKHEKLPDFAVRFIGYSCRIIARKGNTDYAGLDFVSGAATLFADEGFLCVPKRTSLALLVTNLPACINQLKESAKQAKSNDDGGYLEMRSGEGEINLKRGAAIDRFVSQITRRYRKVEPILEQAEKVGSAINRLPYDDYIDEIAKTGHCRVVFYGDGFFVDGRLLYRPERRTSFVKATEDERSYSVTPDVPSCTRDA